MAQKALESSRKFQKPSQLWPSRCQGTGLPAMLGRAWPHSHRALSEDLRE